MPHEDSLLPGTCGLLKRANQLCDRQDATLTDGPLCGQDAKSSMHQVSLLKAESLPGISKCMSVPNLDLTRVVFPNPSVLPQSPTWSRRKEGQRGATQIQLQATACLGFNLTSQTGASMQGTSELWPAHEWPLGDPRMSTCASKEEWRIVTFLLRVTAWYGPFSA